MVKTIQSSEAVAPKTCSIPDTEKSMQELAGYISKIQEVKSKRDEHIREACERTIEEIEKNIQFFKTEIKRFKSGREFLMAQLSEEKLLQHIEAKRILMNKSLFKR